MLSWHVIRNWTPDKGGWLLVMVRIATNMFGVPTFVFVAGVAFGLSWQLGENKGICVQEQRQKSLARTGTLALISGGYNLVGVLVHGYGWENLWFWYILQTVLWCRLLALGIVHWDNKSHQLIVALGIIAITPFILNGLNFGQDLTGGKRVLYFILFNPLDADSPLFFLPTFIIGMILGSEMGTITIDPSNTQNINLQLKKWLLCGGLFITAGVLLGWQQVDTEIGWHYIDQLNLHPDINILTLPFVLIRGSYAWCLFTIGCNILLLTFIFYRVDLPNKENSKNTHSDNWLDLYGRYSLTIYLGHYLYFIIHFNISFCWIWLPMLIILTATGGIIKQLEKLGQGRYSFEYGMALVIRKFNSITDRKNEGTKNT